MAKDDDDLRRFHLTKDPAKGDWKLQEEGSERPRARFETKADATKGGTLSGALGAKGGSVRIHKTDSRIQEERTFPRGRDGGVQCVHPLAARVPLYAEDGCNVEGCSACGYSIDNGVAGKYRTCPFCSDWFIDEIDEGGEELVCQGCGATAPIAVWNFRPSFGAPTEAAPKGWESPSDEPAS